MNNPWNVIQSLEADNSRLAKEQIIAQEAAAGNAEFFEGCRLALDAMITFGVKAVSEKEKDEGVGLSWAGFRQLADALTSRQLTGNDAQTAIAHARMKATKEQWNYWFRRILIKDMRAGFSEKTINKVVENDFKNYAISQFSVQLAHDSANHESKVSGEKLIEVKLDGVRVIAIVYPTGAVSLFSRNGKSLDNFPLVEQQLSKHAKLFTEPMVLDGEIMSASFQDLMKQIHRKDDTKSTDAVLNLFDILTLKDFQAGRSERTQLERSAWLKQWYEPLAEHLPNVSIVGQELVNLDKPEGQARFKEINQQAVEGGYEGLLIKDPEAVYQCKRSVAWLKKKPVISVDLKVVALEEGTGKNVGVLGALVCEGVDQDKSIKVNVGSGLTDQQRKDMWSNQELVVGQTVEILADAITISQDSETYSLRFPRFCRFRDDK